jgi:hypothetical protein
MIPSAAVAPKHIAFCDQHEFFRANEIALLEEILDNFILVVLALGYVQKTFAMPGYRKKAL